MSTSTTSKNPVQFRVIIPKKIMVKWMIAPIRDACIADAKAMQKDLDKVSKTWEGEVPETRWKAELNPPAPDVFHSSFTASAYLINPASLGYKKFMWLDQGTKVRYATMTPKFIPKTRAGQLNSWKGKGGMLFVSKKHPRPGIKKRQFQKALLDKWKKPFHDHMEKAVEKAAKLSGHSR